ncbi:DUF262 domain-containing protein [uncultured Trichococcus sp.]|uniref:GmrSD restriction endonuclease domain-containing protein n=1 Tax=uncultured Trichococcus sp. TaxID=189665 RepID=UPI002A188612|nr:DUF262 domain-containing protein [uncultured Trichococcus sp.]
MSTYETKNMAVSSVLTAIRDGNIAIPEIQRPFVWDAVKVRDLMDSMYNGYPIGFIITWRNADTRLKDGSVSSGKSIIIDGQQRITALTAAMVGQEVLNKKFQKKRIKISFNPIEERFEVWTPALDKSSKWIPDISVLFPDAFNQWQFINDYVTKNESTDGNRVGNVLAKLIGMKNIQIGVIELSSELEIETVTEIFTRINSKGVSLSQSDFVMSKIASNTDYQGVDIRKAIDYFCHALASPSDFVNIKNNDHDFVKSHLFEKISWVGNQKLYSYIPKYADMVKVIFAYKFKRGKIGQLVQLLSGRDFDAKENREEIAEETFHKFEDGLIDFCNKNNFENYTMILQSMGIHNFDYIRSINALNFGYALYLLLKEKKVDAQKRDFIVRRFVMLSLLTQRFSGSSESQIDFDIRRFDELDPEKHLADIEAGQLSDAFWNHTLIQRLETNQIGPIHYIYLFTQIKEKDKGFLSNPTTVQSMLDMHGDIHHIFPKNYLRKNGINDKREYNQIANYAMVKKEINIKISDKAPRDYLHLLGLSREDSIVRDNFEENAVPIELFDMDVNDYQEFLSLRRKLMASKIKGYYYSL